MLKVRIDAEQIDPLAAGTRQCQARQGGPHGATWCYVLRVVDEAAIVKHVKGERSGYLCDRHLYGALQYRHNEIQSMEHLRAAVGRA